MKVIDLLNKISNSEELPEKIHCFNKEFYLKENTYFGDTFTLMHYIQEEDLNNEVEILEEKKIPEKIKDKYCSQISKVELAQKYNEIIDYLDYLKSKGDK